MARPFNRTFKSNTIVASPALAAETIVCQVGNVSTDGATQAVVLLGYIAFTVGATGTAARIRIRQTGLAGIVVADSGAMTAGIAAAALVGEGLNNFDLPGDVDGFVYVLTLQVTGGSSTSTVSSTSLIAIVSD